jgi:uncharacterized protein YfdQ (DUF2303 family)
MIDQAAMARRLAIGTSDKHARRVLRQFVEETDAQIDRMARDITAAAQREIGFGEWP